MAMLMEKKELETLKRHLIGGLGAINKLIGLTNKENSCKDITGACKTCDCSNADRFAKEGHPDTDSVKVAVCDCKTIRKH